MVDQLSEAKTSVVKLGFDGIVSKVVLEHCYTDEVKCPCDETGKGGEESIVRLAMEVASAADYFALPSLCDKEFGGQLIK